ncbi:AAA-domain-containing protein [Cristinia sonorae]|uniref:AAA-domain-containing protein n=1 Tax=Cristinia sonorae TaxID=1940300 RepID=A0A8K0UXQ4_9AGAR|nr:AAA-domain-containing protein [Cristinia sonorae]
MPQGVPPATAVDLSSLLVPNAASSKREFVFDNSDPPAQNPQGSPSKVTIRIPATTSMAPNTRSADRRRTMSNASGSEYLGSNASSADADMTVEVEDDLPKPKEEVVYATTYKGRKTPRLNYHESSEAEDDEDEDEDELNVLDQPDQPASTNIVADEPSEDGQPRRVLRNRAKTNGTVPRTGAIVSDEDGEPVVSGRVTRSRRTLSQPPQTNGRSKPSRTRPTRNTSSRSKARPPARRGARQNAHDPEDDDNYVQESDGSVDADGSIEDAVPSSPDADGEEDAEGDLVDDRDGDGDVEVIEENGKPYSLRRRQNINYAIPPPLEDMPAPPKSRGGEGRPNGRPGPNKRKGPGWSASGAVLDRWLNGDDSDSDHPTRTPRKGRGLGGGGMFAGGVGNPGGGLLPPDLAAAGTPSNLGKVGDATLADVDPLGVNQNVTFDEVGGLDDHINALKEMTLLPLLYPEVFQRFNVTPPRGVLFHGPPGTGKTLLARALAASCRSNGKGISFFMRKGADILSKWVGEAERQLRLLFEEAKNQQPSIIFFDEIDGLAPVRSSKQDQIHASIVSTLLALMDGMDGRGQVVVIGATNRPDAIDPALRRPGRFDREFYFPLPGLEARERILKIMTKQWAGWEDQKGEDACKGLAKLTKGYGGADLRALCTEAALNAVQRRYPQIYKSTERLLLDPTSINVELRDFMISVRKLIPSSARATASAASPLPTQLVPLLNQCVENVKEIINRVLPISKKRSALEEAEFEDEEGEDALEREMMLQSMETLRVHRPRVVVHGAVGMGQDYVAAAALHYLEGYHIQNLDIGTLIGDSTRTPEATIVQLFIEAKRHQPSVVYIPSLAGWCASLSETARMTVRAMLDSLVPTDPVLLLAVVDGSFDSLPHDVRAWFGPVRDNRVELTSPSVQQREDFFKGLIADIGRKPTQFPDGVKRKKRVLEDLPIAPPLAPREPTAAELALQEENDVRIILNLQYRLGLILTELKRKFKRFTKRAADEYNYDFYQVPMQVDVVTTTVEVQETATGDVMEIVNEEHTQDVVGEPSLANGISEVPVREQVQMQPQLFDMDLEHMHVNLYRDRYLTPDDFLDDIQKIARNAELRAEDDADRFLRAQAMLTAARLSLSDIDAHFRLECERMAGRERKRREARRKAKGKERASDPQAPAPSIRRSGRTNGQSPELTITDPVQLERRLKRQRSAEVTQSPSDDDRDREAKRSRLSAEAHAEDDTQPPAIPTTPHRPHAVRFADPEPPLPAPVFVDAPEPTPEASTSNYLPRKASDIGSLLNPIPSPVEPPPMPGPSLDIPHNNMGLEMQTVGPAPEATPSAVSDPVSHSLFPPPDVPATSDVFMEPSTSQSANPTLVITPPAEPMEVVMREPTPPPDFILDTTQLDELHRYMRDSTHALNVEQLEQLRASCLSTVWRHRSEWDRTSLLHELRTIVFNFVADVTADDVSL